MQASANSGQEAADDAEDNKIEEIPEHVIEDPLIAELA